MWIIPWITNEQTKRGDRRRWERKTYWWGRKRKTKSRSLSYWCRKNVDIRSCWAIIKTWSWNVGRAKETWVSKIRWRKETWRGKVSRRKKNWRWTIKNGRSKERIREKKSKSTSRSRKKTLGYASCIDWKTQKEYGRLILPST